MNAVRVILLCLSICSSVPVSPVWGTTQAAMAAQACKGLEKNNSEMEKLRQTILKKHQGDMKFIVAFKKAQTAWLAYRDAHLEALYPQDPATYGSVHGMCRCIVLNRMTRERIETLQKWLSPAPEGDVCAGSMR